MSSGRICLPCRIARLLSVEADIVNAAIVVSEPTSVSLLEPALRLALSPRFTTRLNLRASSTDGGGPSESEPHDSREDALIYRVA